MKPQPDTATKIARKSAARLTAVQAIYQMDNNNQRSADVLREFVDHRIGVEVDGEQVVAADLDLLSGIVTGLETRRSDIEGMVSGALGEKQKPEALLMNILLCGTYELMAHNDIDAPIIISDYVDVAHAFYEGKEPGLVNAVLDRLAKDLR